MDLLEAAVSTSKWVTPALLAPLRNDSEVRQPAEGPYSELQRATLNNPNGDSEEVMVKFLRPEMLRAGVTTDELMAVAGRLTSLDSPYLVRFLGFGSRSPLVDLALPSGVFIVEAACNAVSLCELLTQQMRDGGKLLYKRTDALRWSVQIATALCDLHAATPAVLHGCLTPDVVMLSGKLKSAAHGNVRLDGYGLHEVLRIASVQDVPSSAAFCQPNSVLESLAYLAPECMKGTARMPSSDIYSLGVLLYELFTYQLAFVALSDRCEEMTVAEYICAVSGGMRPPFPGIIAGCWAHRPELRLTAAAALRLLRMQAQSAGMVLDTNTTDTPPKSRAHPVLQEAHSESFAEACSAAALDVGADVRRLSLRMLSVRKSMDAFMKHTSDMWVDSSQLIFTGKLKMVGEGAYASVQKAALCVAGGDTTRPVAVKQLKAETLKSEEDVKNFLWECIILCQMQHPSIAQVIGMGSDEPLNRDKIPRKLFLVQDYMDGGDLERLLMRQMCLPTRRLYRHVDALRWGLQIARALRHCHSAHPMVIHRDLKPANVLLKGTSLKQANAFIADFGLGVLIAKKESSHPAACDMGLAQTTCMASAEAKAAYRSISGVVAHNPALAEYGVMEIELKTYQLTGLTGSFAYMAPEVYKGQPYNEKVDIFSFGCILFELLTREQAFLALNARGEAGELQDYVRAVCVDGYRPPFPSTMDPQLKELVNSCWAQEPDERPSAAQVVVALKEYMAHSGMPPVPLSPEEPLQRAQANLSSGPQCACVVV